MPLHNRVFLDLRIIPSLFYRCLDRDLAHHDRGCVSSEQSIVDCTVPESAARAVQLQEKEIDFVGNPFGMVLVRRPMVMAKQAIHFPRYVDGKKPSKPTLVIASSV